VRLSSRVKGRRRRRSQSKEQVRPVSVGSRRVALTLQILSRLLPHCYTRIHRVNTCARYSSHPCVLNPRRQKQRVYIHPTLMSSSTTCEVHSATKIHPQRNGRFLLLPICTLRLYLPGLPSSHNNTLHKLLLHIRHIGNHASERSLITAGQIQQSRARLSVNFFAITVRSRKQCRHDN
jgi:hypothetical protein